MKSFWLRLLYVMRFRTLKKISGFVRASWYAMNGMKIYGKLNLPRMNVTWPHQVSIGENCQLEQDIYFKFDGVFKPGPSIRIGNNVFIGSGCEFNIREFIEIGNDALISSGCRFIDHDHGMLRNEIMRIQHGPEKPILIGNDVWIGCNVIVLKGVKIESGAIVAAGAVVTKSIAAFEIWAGVPARKVGQRN